LENSAKDIIEFTLVYNRHKSRLYFYIYKMMNDKMVTEDIIQNVFIKYYENMSNIREKEYVASWIYTTARNEIFSLFRKKLRKSEEIVNEDYEFPAENNLAVEYENIELKKIIMNELELLPQEQKEVYLLREYSGLSYKEIADIQQIDEELVKSRLFKTRQKLIKRVSKIIAP
jgi:RNA polymerase sigma-70 factor (ECF subfamily)